MKPLRRQKAKKGYKTTLAQPTNTRTSNNPIIIMTARV